MQRVVAAVLAVAAAAHASSFGVDYGLSQGPDAIHATSQAELEFPAVVESSGGSLDSVLVFDQYYYGGAVVEFWTRALNGSIPGPTFIISRGDIWRLKLINNLLPQPFANTGHNEHRDPNTTNIHTHGLHVSGEGTEDNVFTELAPGETFDYTYTIPCQHRGGTFWYHPHHHGSTALQVGGGAAGAIIVRDEPGEIPSDWEALPERLWVIQHMLLEGAMNTFENAAASGSALAREVAVSHGNSRDFMLVNGMYLPTMTISTGAWYRVRIIFAGQSNYARLQLSDTTRCTMNILAKDGIYVSDAPRTGVPAMVLAPGSRVDVALFCSEAGTYTVQGGAGARRRLRKEKAQHGREAMGPPPNNGAGAGGGGAGDEWVGDIMTLTVTGATSTPAALSAFVPANFRPNYLPDLTQATPDQSLNLALQGGARALNGVTFVNSDVANALFNLQIGQIQEWTLTGIDAHPWHLHINSFQLITINNDENGYFAVGDYHDVWLNPSGNGGGTARSVTDMFTGHQVMHCHILAHEDEGMMGFAQINGVEGTLYGGSDGCVAASSTPTNTPTNTPTPSISDTATPTPSISDTATPTTSVSDTATPTPSISDTATPTPSVSDTATPTPSISDTATPSESRPATDSSSPTPSTTGTTTPSESTTPSATPSISTTASALASGEAILTKSARLGNVDYDYVEANPAIKANIIAAFQADIASVNAAISASDVRVTGTREGSYIIDYDLVVPAGAETAISSSIDSSINTLIQSNTVAAIPNAALEDTSAGVTGSTNSSDDDDDSSSDSSSTLIIILVVVGVVLIAVVVGAVLFCKKGKPTGTTGTTGKSVEA